MQNKYSNDAIKNELNDLIKQIQAIQYLHCVEAKIENQINGDSYEELLQDYHNNIITLSGIYNIFYTKATALLSIILPERLEEFKSCYIFDNKSRINVTRNRTISNYFNNINNLRQPFEDTFEKQILNLFIQQENILKSAEQLIDSVLYELENKIQYNFFMDELSAAEQLLKKKYIRTAGVIAGVALESHLKTICKNRGIKLNSKDTLNKFIVYLRDADVIDFIAERKLQTLGDIRNLCAHKKDREPSEDEVTRLISETKNILMDII